MIPLDESLAAYEALAANPPPKPITYQTASMSYAHLELDVEPAPLNVSLSHMHNFCLRILT